MVSARDIAASAERGREINGSDGRAPDGRIRRSGPGPACVIRTGRDLTRAEPVAALVKSAQDALGQGAPHLVIDLRRADLADAKIVAALVHIARLARKYHARLDVTASSCVHAWLRLCGLESRAGR